MRTTSRCRENRWNESVRRRPAHSMWKLPLRRPSATGSRCQLRSDHGTAPVTRGRRRPATMTTLSLERPNRRRQISGWASSMASIISPQTRKPPRSWRDRARPFCSPPEIWDSSGVRISQVEHPRRSGSDALRLFRLSQHGEGPERGIGHARGDSGCVMSMVSIYPGTCSTSKDRSTTQPRRLRGCRR